MNEFFIPDLADLVEKYARHRPIEEEKYVTFSYGYVDLNDQKEGLWISYFSNGNKKSEEHYHQGQLEGLSILYNPFGTKSSEGYYHESKQEGLLIFYFLDGTKQLEGRNHQNQREGLWIFYNEDGTKREEMYY